MNIFWNRDLMPVFLAYVRGRKAGYEKTWKFSFTGITVGQWGFGIVHRPVTEDKS